MRKKFILSLQLIVNLFLVISSSFGEEDKIIISSFEKEDELEKWTTQYQAKIEMSEEYATEGKHSAKATFPSKDYPGIFIHPGEDDWSKYAYFCAELYNPQSETMGVAASFSDSSGREITRYDFGNIVGENINYGKIYIPSLKKNNPAKFRNYIKPMFKKLFTTCRKAGTHVGLSSDGRLLEIVDDLVECGVSMHDPQLRANTIDGIARSYKGKMCINLDLDRQMFGFCKPEDIRDQVKEAVKKLNLPEGGLMISGLIYDADVPLENIEAICLAFEEFCFK